ncbi:hypothetical protein AB4Z21_00905 [Paenibacillus sp. MCAF20]
MKDINYVGIDPSTKTGIVVLDTNGEAILKQEIQLVNGIRSTERELLDYGRHIVSMVPPGSKVCVEDFSYGSQGQGVSTQYAVGYSIRFALLDAGIPFIKPTPSQLKKFATGKGNTTKDNMTIPILRLWDFEHKSDNVRDAFVLAQIAKALAVPNIEMLTSQLYNYQTEVLQAILSPAEKKKKAK